MSRAVLIAAAGLAGALVSIGAFALDPHLDPGLVPSGCPACHVGHGQAGSPMLARPQKDVCLGCHDTQARMQEQVGKGHLAAGIEPPSLTGVLEQPYGHTVAETGFTADEARGALMCTSCHSPHRSSPESRFRRPSGERKRRSPRDPEEMEHELCTSCHGGDGIETEDPRNIARLIRSNSESFHPIQGPAPRRVPSTLEGVGQGEINCTDCHSNADAAEARGPHGSRVPYLLSGSFSASDGNEESEATYELCYSCHDRERVLDSVEFPEHRRHVVDQQASCATCHNPHGSIRQRALIRFGEESTVSSIGASPETGRFEFVSSAPGSGACYLTCHGVDHAPATYGSTTEMEAAVGGVMRRPGDRRLRPERSRTPPGRRRPRWERDR